MKLNNFWQRKKEVIMIQMKDSEVKWIGRIPENWDIAKIKFKANIYTGNSISDNEKENYEDSEDAIPYIATKDINVNNHKIDYENGMFIKENDNYFKRAPKNSSLLCIEGGSAGKKIGYTNQTVCFVNKLCCFTSDIMNNKFLFYTLNSNSFKEDFNQNIFGLIGGVSTEKIKNIKITVPSLKEQKSIVDFLDDKCEQIDKLIEIQEKEIDKLKEYRTSVITKAVTKGLDETVPMKDSGIDWIGKIPEHWDVGALKYNLKEKMIYGANESGVEYNEGLPRYIRITDIANDNKLKDNDKLSLTYEQAESFMLKDGDVLFARSGGTVGKTFIYKDAYGLAAFAGYLICARCGKFMLPDYLYYWTLSNSYFKWTNRIFIQSTIQNIGANRYENMEICRPTINEQREIVKCLNNYCKEFDKIILFKQQKIEKLQDYKKSLIYEYVTGKKQVND